MLKYDCTLKDKVTIGVIDQLGRVVLVKEVTVNAGINQVRLNTAALAKGEYEIKMGSMAKQESIVGCIPDFY